MLEKFKSRKFLMALSAQIIGLIVLFYPDQQGEIESSATNVSALLLMALTAMGWIRAEGEVDASRENTRATLENTKLYHDKEREEYARSIVRLDEHERRARDTGRTAGSGPAAGMFLLALLFLPAMGCTALAGKSATQMDAWYELRADLNAANRTYIAFSQSGDINDPEHAERVLEWGTKLQTARALLAQAKPLADQPGEGFDDLFNQIEAILIGLAGPTSEYDRDRITSPDRRPAWRLRDHQHHQSTLGSSGSGWRDQRRAA